MRVKQIKDELESYGISTRTFLEKGELVEALIQARKEGKTPIVTSSTSSSSSADSTKKSKKKKRRSSDNDDEEVKAKVEVITSDNVGPKTKKSRDSQQGSGSNPFSGGGGGSPFGGMGGMEDILKNMGGAGMGGAGANPFGGDAMKAAQQAMANPKVMAVIQKAQKNPKVMQAVQECMGNPMAMSKYMSDPDVGPILKELQEAMM